MSSKPQRVIHQLGRSLRRDIRTSRGLGFTILEVMIVVAIIGTLAAIAIPAYGRITFRAQILKAITDIRTIGTDIDVFEAEHSRLPTTLTEVNRAGMIDPWGNPYEYLSFEDAGPSWKGKVRKDHSLHPLNTSYDLYSTGKDGQSTSPLTAKASRDDIIRANDGGFIGLASDY